MNQSQNEKQSPVKKKKVPLDYTIGVDATHHVVFCNGKPLLTPAGHAYALPTEKLARAIAAEWKEQSEKEKIVAQDMPLTQLAATAIDIVAKKRAEIIGALVAYSATELLCHRTDFPPALSARQQEIWQPVLDWCALRFGALFQVGTGVMPIIQSPACVEALERALEIYGNFHLTGLRHAADTSGSLVLGLALVEGFRSADEVLQAAELETSFQIESWGDDPVISARLDSVNHDFASCALWFDLLKA